MIDDSRTILCIRGAVSILDTRLKGDVKAGTVHGEIDRVSKIITFSRAINYQTRA
jgi:hypothetical protein